MRWRLLKSLVTRFKVEVLIFIGLCIVGCLVSVSHGPDTWWDLFQYHVYNGWAAVSGRGSADFFPAGMQGFFDPALDIPYYVIVVRALENHPVLAAALEGLPYGFLLYLAWLVARQLSQHIGVESPTLRTGVAALAVVVGGTGVATWAQVGRQDGEIPLADIVLIGVAIFVYSLNRDGALRARLSTLVLLGALFGLAPALKLTAGTYAPAMGLCVLLAGRGQARWSNALFYLAGCVGTFLVVYAPWGVHVLAMTGNPFFPNFNNVFHSNWMSDVWVGNLGVARPSGVAMWLFYPFYWLAKGHLTVFDYAFRDARLAAAYAAIVVAAVVELALRIRNQKPLLERPVWLAVCFAAVSYATWLAMFSYLRYAVAIEVLGAILLVLLLASLAARVPLPQARIATSVAVVAFACGIVGFTRAPILGERPPTTFGKTIFSVTSPTLPKDALVILAYNRLSFLVPFWQNANPTAHFTTLDSCLGAGGWCHPLFYDYGVGERVRAFIAVHKAHLYVAYLSGPFPPLLSGPVAFGIVTDDTRCQPISTNVELSVRVCKARFVGASAVAWGQAEKFHYVARLRIKQPGASARVLWLENPCVAVVRPAQMDFAKLRLTWRDALGPTTVYVPDSSGNPTALTVGGASGEVDTGTWVTSGLTFTLRLQNGRMLGSVYVDSTPCAAAATPSPS